MTRLALIRHGETAWTEAGRIQGRADVALSAAGCRALARRRLPKQLAGARVTVSPLKRAVATAELLGATAVTIEPRLVEMDWGAWEGKTLAELRAQGGAALAANEALGLDFHPDGGESPRQVQTRVAPWLATEAARGATIVAVTHKGVIRAILARAAGWDMTGKPPVKLDWTAAHLFLLAPDGTPSVERMNLPLNRHAAPRP